MGSAADPASTVASAGAAPIFGAVAAIGLVPLIFYFRSLSRSQPASERWDGGPFLQCRTQYTLIAMEIRAATSRATKPRSILHWFADAATPRNAYGVLAFAAIGYSVGVALPLSVAQALPMPDPYLRIPNADYFFWGTFFYAPVIIAAWLIASSVMYVLARAFRSPVDFGELLRLSAFASGLGTLGTLLPDLVTSPMRAIGVIDEQAWETSVTSQGGWFVFLWGWMLLYLALFLICYPIAARIATRLSWVRAITIGVIGFTVFQGFEYIFIR